MEKFKGAKYIFVVGIGGSDLASKAVWNAMSLHKIDENKKILFLESPDTREYEEVESLIKNEITNLEDFVLVAISKSGQTVETLEAFNKTYEILKGHPLEQNSLRVPLGKINERTLVISSPNTPLWKLAEEKEIERLSWEKNVGGRFSAFTTPHLTVLSMAGLNVVDFVEGGKEMAKKCDENPEENIAKNLAKNILDSKVNILDFFIFNSELEDLGKWCRQLIAESLSLITPTVSIGPTDLHSMLELYLGGPKDRFTIFIKSEKEIDESINESAYENVVTAYEKIKLPFEKYEMPEISEKELGKFMAFMIETTLYLAELLGVDPYDQPAVENYKKSLRN